MLAYVSITLFLRIISVFHGAGRGFRQGVMFCVPHKHVHQGGSIQPRGATWNQKQQNILRWKKTRSGKRNSIVTSRDARIPLALLCGDEVPCFLLTLRLPCAIRWACPHLVLGFIPYVLRRGARAGGSLMYSALFQKGGHVYPCSGLSVCPSEGHQMSTEFRGLGCVCDVVLWSRTKGKRGRECKVAPFSLLFNLIILGLARSFVRLRLCWCVRTVPVGA